MRNIHVFAAVWLLGNCLGTHPLCGQDQNPSAARTIVCDETHKCSHQFTNGSEFKIITDNGIVVAVGPDNGLLLPKFRSITVIISNHTSTSIDVIPSEMVFDVWPKEKKLRPITPDRVAKTFNHGNEYTSIMQMALNSNTVDPGQSVSGSIFFERDKKAKIAYLFICVGETVYEFQFDADALH